MLISRETVEGEECITLNAHSERDMAALEELGNLFKNNNYLTLAQISVGRSHLTLCILERSPIEPPPTPE